MWVDAGGWDDLGDAVGGEGDAPVAVGAVHQPVVEAAEQAAVLDVGLAAVGPAEPGVVGVCPRGRPVAAGEHAAAVAVREGDLLLRG